MDDETLNFAFRLLLLEGNIDKCSNVTTMTKSQVYPDEDSGTDLLHDGQYCH